MTNKERILDIVSKNNCWMTAKNILESINNIDKTTIYRNLEKLVYSWDFIEDFSNSWEKTYSIKENHHHHFICDKCSKKINIGCILDEKIKKFEKDLNIKINNHSFLLSGFCEKCKL
jgi:Fe2+ or Zn2+ uptake regulation protein